MNAPATTDPQEHVAAIYTAVTIIEEDASSFEQVNILGADEVDKTDAEILDTLHAAKRGLEAAADAFIDLQTERDDMLAALVALVEEAQPLGIEREAYRNALALVIEHHDQAAAALPATLEQRDEARRYVKTLTMVLDLAVQALPGEHPYGDVPGAIAELVEQRDSLLAAMNRCYKMLLSEPDTHGALSKAENILREAIANAVETTESEGKWA